MVAEAKCLLNAAPVGYPGAAVPPVDQVARLREGASPRTRLERHHVKTSPALHRFGSISPRAAGTTRSTEIGRAAVLATCPLRPGGGAFGVSPFSGNEMRRLK